ALNRAVALAQVRGPRAALPALAEIPDPQVLAHYHLFPAVAGTLWLEAGDRTRAAAALRRALALAPTAAERELLARRLAACAE
ncbi:MAG: RNA polymerase subunit sigma-70, partial [Opitutae bacterium]|nr:RNA polymerase subunit sigma-70 [Opitutae bacterium]